MERKRKLMWLNEEATSCFNRVVVYSRFVLAQVFLFSRVSFLTIFHYWFIAACKTSGMFWNTVDGEKKDNLVPVLWLGRLCRSIPGWSANWCGWTRIAALYGGTGTNKSHRTETLRACHPYVFQAGVFRRRNSVTPVLICTIQCRIGMNLYGFWNTPKIEELILVACNLRLGRNWNTTSIKNLKKMNISGSNGRCRMPCDQSITVVLKKLGNWTRWILCNLQF